MQKTKMQMVAEFHQHLKISLRQEMPTHQNSKLDHIGRQIAKLAGDLESWMKHEPDDGRWLRAHLMVEEVGELCVAMAAGDVVEVLDGLADLEYVTVGSAEMFGLPLDEAFDEVHRSNMTKEKQPDDPSSARVRVKGPNYSPPDIKGVLEKCLATRQ